MADPHKQFLSTSPQCRVMLLHRATSLSSGGDYDIDSKTMPLLCCNWLQVVGAPEGSQVEQRVCPHLHALRPRRDACQAAPPPRAFVRPRHGALATPASRVAGGL